MRVPYAGVEVVADLSGVAWVELSAEERGDVLSTNSVYRRTDQGVVEGGKILTPPEHDVGGVLDLHEAPVVAGGELRGSGAELADVLIELVVQRLGSHAVGELLGPLEVVDLDEGVVDELVGDLVTPAGQ